MSLKCYIKNPMNMIERRLNMTVSRKPHLINALGIRVSDP